MFYLRFALAVAAFAISAGYGVAIAVFRRDRSRVARDYAQLLARLMRPALGLDVRVLGEAKLGLYRPCIYIINHQSVADVPALAGIYPKGTVVIGKKELRSIPFFGWLYVRTGNILIDRSDRQHSVGRLQEAEAAILERHVSVLIFPEGTRGRVAGELLPFKKGAFHMAIATGVPLVPVVVSPLRDRVNFRARRIRPGPVEIRVLDPIWPTDYSHEQAGELAALAHETMQAELDRMTRNANGPAGSRAAVRPDRGSSPGLS